MVGWKVEPNDDRCGAACTEIETRTGVRDIHAPSLIRFGMDADRVGNWAPFLVALLLLAISGWGIVNIPAQQSAVEAGSENMIPQFVEHFPMTESDVVPNDGLTRLAWHPAESNLGSMKTDDRFLISPLKHLNLIFLLFFKMILEIKDGVGSVSYTHLTLPTKA